VARGFGTAPGIWCQRLPRPRAWLEGGERGLDLLPRGGRGTRARLRGTGRAGPGRSPITVAALRRAGQPRAGTGTTRRRGLDLAKLIWGRLAVSLHQARSELIARGRQNLAATRITPAATTSLTAGELRVCPAGPARGARRTARIAQTAVHYGRKTRRRAAPQPGHTANFDVTRRSPSLGGGRGAWDRNTPAPSAATRPPQTRWRAPFPKGIGRQKDGG